MSEDKTINWAMTVKECHNRHLLALMVVEGVTPESLDRLPPAHALFLMLKASIATQEELGDAAFLLSVMVVNNTFEGHIEGLAKEHVFRAAFDLGDDARSAAN